jgi:hypothetical protein
MIKTVGRLCGRNRDESLLFSCGGFLVSYREDKLTSPLKRKAVE